MATILTVDDERSILYLLREVILHMGHTVEQAGDGAEAIELLQNQAFDLILTDLQMPHVNGMAVLKAAKALPNPPQVLFLTGHSSVQSAVQAMKYGAFDYLTKPLNIDELRIKITVALQQRDMQHKLQLQAQKLEKHQKMLQRDLELAATIQETLLPAPIDTDQIGIHLLHRPMLEVGGDFGAIQLVQNNFVYLTLIDVTGHGIAAALVVNRLCNEIRTLVQARQQPREILHGLNDFFIRNLYRTGSFLTAFSCMIDLNQNQLIYAGSAHPAMLFWEKTNQSLSLLESQNTIIGFHNDTLEHFHETQRYWSPGDRLLLYSDGIVEAENAEQVPFGIQGLSTAFSDCKDLSISTVPETIYTLAKEHIITEPRDDIYLMAVEFK